MPSSVLRRIAPLLLVLTLAAACSSSKSETPSTSAATSGGSASSPNTATSSAPVTTPAPSSTKPTAAAKAVKISSFNTDGATYGIGMPLIFWFDVAPTDSTALTQDTVVTVNGEKTVGYWYFEQTSHVLGNGKKAALEGHWRPQTYWPAHSEVSFEAPIQGKSAGPGLVFANQITLDFAIGASHIVSVDARSLQLTVNNDGTKSGPYLVSLGSTATPTKNGTKVIMEKGLDISMRGPGYFDAHVKFTQRLTYDGEYLHAAPWNIRNLGKRSTSNGCTNLSPKDAETLYGMLSQGDVVLYPNATGPRMALGDGFGDWNVPWNTWKRGGELLTH